MNIRALTLDLKKSEYLDDKKREAMIEQYDKIPTFWKERSKQIKWEFILTDEMPLKQNEGKKIALIAESSKKKTWINVTLSHKVFGTLLYKAFAQFVLTTNLQMIILHEFGHVLDEYCSMPSIRDDFLFIFNDERELAKNFCRNEFEYKYISSNSMEFFAETFARYISSKEVLPPRTYHFLKNLISK